MKGGSVRRRAGVAGLIAAAAAAATAAGQAAGPVPAQDAGPVPVAPPASVPAAAAPAVAAVDPALGYADENGPADEFVLRRPSMNLFGVTGLIDTPTAEMQPDGQLSFTSAWIGGQFRNTLHFQALPWLSGTFRYTSLPDYREGGASLYDRSFDIKLRLAEEGEWTPALALGLQDFLGTGVFSGEYIVATKTVLPELTVSGGLGWGRFASAGGINNPLGLGFPSFYDRQGSDAQFGNTGQVRFDRFFHGDDMAVFGGLEWRTPVEGLTFKAEYSSDDYARDWQFSSNDAKLPLNFGLEYRAWDTLELGAYFIQGDAFAVRATLSGNPSKPLSPPDARPGPPPVRPRAAQPVPQQIVDRFGPVRELIDAAPAAPGPTPAARLALDTAAAGPRWAEAPAPSGLAAGECPLDAARRIDAELGVIDGVTFVDAQGEPVCTVVLRPAGRAYIAAEAAPLQGWDAGWFDDPAQRAAARAAALAAVQAETVTVHGFALSADTIRLEIENPRYQAAAEAIGRTAAALTGALPPSVEKFEITLLEGALPVATVKLRRTMLETVWGEPDAAQRAWLGVSLEDPALDGRPAPVEGLYPRFAWGINPDLPLGLFDPDAPVRADLRLRLNGTVEVSPGLSASASVTQRLYGTLDEIDRESDSVLPHVRSDSAEYARTDTPVIERLTADYVFKLAPDVYARASAGLFETQFGGVGAEVLWKPTDSDWAFGAELNYVQQRDFDGLLGFRDYDVVTGHASVYWDTGWHGVRAQVDAGRYLAGDYGATFSLTRTFANGWEIGGFFTLTDVPFDEYGEGSFDKGLRLTIPFGWGLPYETRSQISTTLKPLTRDGGQRLIVENRLYDSVREGDAQGLRDDWSAFWK